MTGGGIRLPVRAVTPREADILHGIANGHTLQQIADLHHLGLNTVKTHAARAYARLGAVNAAHAVHLAHLAGVFTNEGDPT